MVETTKHRVETTGQGDVHDLTALVLRVVSGSSLESGLATVAVVGSTAGITTIEFEPGAVADLNRVWDRPSISIPFDDGQLCVGTWQQIVLIEFDTRARTREVIVQLVG